jgi:hypothetical protein
VPHQDKNNMTKCTSKLSLGAFDCINPLMFKNPKDRAEMLKFKHLCEAPNNAACMTKMSSFQGWFKKGGVCCPPGDKCNTGHDADGPPGSCTKPCAMTFLPFVEQCGEIMIKMISDDKNSDNKIQQQVRTFSAKCTVALGGH